MILRIDDLDPGAVGQVLAGLRQNSGHSFR